jgi:hypothetical protein
VVARRTAKKMNFNFLGPTFLCRALFLTHDKGDLCRALLTVYFGTPSMFITLWFGFDYGTKLPLGTLII